MGIGDVSAKIYRSRRSRELQFSRPGGTGWTVWCWGETPIIMIYPGSCSLKLSFLVVFFIFCHNGDRQPNNFFLLIVSSMWPWGLGSRIMFWLRWANYMPNWRAWVFQRLVISIFSHFFSSELTLSASSSFHRLDLISKIYYDTSDSNY